MRELRHDFRARYGASYDDVPTDEAIDLVLSLPPGSAYRASLDPDDAWDEALCQMANVLDLLLIVNWRLMGCPEQYRPEPVPRPGDAKRRAEAARRAASAREKIEGIEWEEV